MLGQDKLKSKLRNYNSLDNHNIILLGEYGCEWKEAVKFLCEYKSLNMELADGNTTVEEMSNVPCKTLFVFEADKLNEYHQQSLLKMMEEQPPYTYVLIYAISKLQVSDTLRSRCYIINFDKYSPDDLKYISNDELTLNVCSTPGQVYEALNYDLIKLKELCHKIITSISKANYCNTLSIANRFNFKDEAEKYPVWLFCKMLAMDEDINKNMLLSLTIFNKYYIILNDKKHWFEAFLSQVWTYEH